MDWTFLVLHALWILGLAMILAAASYHDWLRRAHGRSFARQMREPAFRAPVYAGLWLVALSVSLMNGMRWWERVAGVVLLVASSEQLWRAAVEARER